jgi:hypothetical protein
MRFVFYFYSFVHPQWRRQKIFPCKVFFFINKGVPSMEHIFPKFIFYNIFFYVRNITKELLQKDFSEGGLKMINLNLFILALKTTWVRKLFRTECKWDNILFSTINQEKLIDQWREIFHLLI